MNDYLINSSGLLIGRGKKDKFREIYRDKFTEKMADFITHTHTPTPIHTERKYGLFDSHCSKKRYTVVQLVWTIVLAKK